MGALPGVMVVLDGAGIPGSEECCRHGVSWYVRSLGSSLLDRLSGVSGTDLVVTLAEAIEEVTGRHRETCDVTDPRSPQATVAIVRVDESDVDVLVLADVFVVLDCAEGAPKVIVDPREVDARRDCASILSGVSSGTREYEDALRSATEAFRARRNKPGGYWIAKDDPAAAGQAVTARVPLDLLNGVALLSNGAGRVVDPYGLTTWSALIEQLRTIGPDETLRRIRALEATAPAADQRPAIPEPDDATIAYCDLS